jgi:hypothetical protein
MAKTVDVNVVFTGICSYAPRDAGPNAGTGGKVDKVTFVMPNGKSWRKSRNPGNAKLIPPHHPFLVAKECDVARVDGLWKGAPPSGRMYEKWVYWLLDPANIHIGLLRTDGVRFGNIKDVIHIPDLVPEAEVSDVCLMGETESVGARVIFESGFLSQRSVTTGRFSIRRANSDKPDPSKEIADEIQVALKDVDLNESGELVLKRLNLNDDKNALEPIILKPSQPLIKIFFGSAPPADLGAVVGWVPNHEHGDSNTHFELHFDISRRRPYPPLPVPSPDVVKETGARGPLAGTDGCPPGSNGG